ncbi:MAG: hypothetical protein NT062_24715 [Proteobacteria bacterium]|nr:hypothetical protein [Pseudomonadota bacterium]
MIKLVLAVLVGVALVVLAHSSVTSIIAAICMIAVSVDILLRERARSAEPPATS